ncbi:MAG: cell wall hydrolase [Sphingopyxis sp.]|jgi:hypothetical protein|nr:cell wall hydrolase [Sphingopyxis sp.]
MRDHSADNEEKMSRLLQAASAVAITLTASVAVILTVPGFAQDRSGVEVVEPASIQADVTNTPDPQISQVEDTNAVIADRVEAEPAPQPVAMPRGLSLSSAVRAIEHRDPENAELRCLATGVFFESRGESLDGQMAVAHVILNRANSGRFAGTVCGVLTQPRQFSFVRGGAVPTAPRGAQWQTAVAIARLAMDGEHANPVPGALFFHATHVSPAWNRPRVGRVGNHVFYR